MKKVYIIIGIILFGTFFSVAHAQTSTQSASISPTIVPSGVPQSAINKYNITFPIASLGNCADFAFCKTYCDDSSHTDACIAYATGKGFYTPSPLKTNQEQILAAAKNTLGCEGISTCAAFCQNPDNMTTCKTFAQKYDLNAGNANKLNNASTLQSAKEQLGCNSEETCKAFCDDKANEQKCSAFAKNSGLKGGFTKQGPGGCTTEEQCKKYCLDSANLVECEKFGYKPKVTAAPSHGSSTQSAMPIISGASPKNATGFPSNVSGVPSRVSISPSGSITPTGLLTGQNSKTMCTSKPNCVWTGTLCKCVEVTTNGATPVISSDSNSSTNQTVTTTTNSGTGSVPTVVQTVKANANPFPTVKGITTQRTWLQQIMNYLFGV